MNIKKGYVKMLSSVAAIFVLIADIVPNTGSFILWGEPKCPKDLLK